MNQHPTRLATCLWLLLASSGCWSNYHDKVPTEPEVAAQAVPTLAPSFTLPAHDGVPVSLDELLADGRPAVLVFYPGHW